MSYVQSIRVHAALMWSRFDRYGSKQPFRGVFGLFSLENGELHGDASIERYHSISRPSLAVEVYYVHSIEGHA